jgi:MFS family permease
VNERKERFDLPGALVFLAGLVALLVGLNRGHEWGWASPSILILLGTAILLLGLFVAIERKARDPMLDLSLFRNRTFSATVASAVINYICVYSIMFLLPFYLIQGRELGPAQAGLLLTAEPIVMAVIAPISGTLSDRIGARLPGTIGMGVLAGGLFLLSRLGPASPLGLVILGLGVCGLGIGIFISPNTSALLGSAPFHRRGIASGILATARNVGMVLGIGLSGAIFTTVTTRLGEGDPRALFLAVQAGFLAALFIAGAGVLTSAIRGYEEPERS